MIFLLGSATRGASPGQTSGKPEFRHYGSSLELANRERGSSVASELTSRTLRPPSPTVLRKISTSSISSTTSTKSSSSSSRPPLPNIKVDLESPRLADYLERPRLVSTLHVRSPVSSPEREIQHQYHSKHDVSQYRNLRLGNFMEVPEHEQVEYSFTIQNETKVIFYVITD